MYSKLDKIVLGICGAVIVVGLPTVAYLYSEVRYYDGRIDATRDLSASLTKLYAEALLKGTEEA